LHPLPEVTDRSIPSPGIVERLEKPLKPATGNPQERFHWGETADLTPEDLEDRDARHVVDRLVSNRVKAGNTGS
jgi:hypothetical protein